MFTPVLIGLAIAMLVAVAFGAAAFIRAAFWGEQDMAKQANDELMWRPSFVRGKALRNWAARSAELITQQRLRAGRTGETAAQLVAEVGNGSVHAMLPLARQAELERIVACPEVGQGIVGITAVEVLAIAADLRRKRSRAEQKEIHDLAMENARAIASNGSHDPHDPPLSCPLQGKHNVCCAYAARPLQCRPLHAVSIAEGMAGRRVQAYGAGVEAPDANGHEQTIARGVELGLARALKSARLDAHTYELNGALAKALETPDAAERWARGENVFASCRRIDLPVNGAVVSRD